MDEPIGGRRTGCEDDGDDGGGGSGGGGDGGGGGGDGGGGGGDGGGGIACGLGDCGYHSGRRGNLSRHRITMHRCLASPLLCCHAAFHTKHEYECHRRQAHAAGYRCAACGRVFSRRALLTRHSYIHAERKPFQCSTCQRYSTASKSNLRRHLLVCVRPRAASPSAAAGGQDRGLPLMAPLAPPPSPLPPLFRASIHITCGPCGPAGAAPVWLPWHPSPPGAHVAGLPAFQPGAPTRAPASLLAPSLFYNPLAATSQSASYQGAGENPYGGLRRAGLLKEEAALSEDTGNQGPIFPPRTALELSEIHRMRHIHLAAAAAGARPGQNFGQRLAEKPGSPAASPAGVSQGAPRTQLSVANATGKRKTYRSFRVSDILSPDD